MRIDKVLIVDDDPGIRRVAEISLTRVGQWKTLALGSGMNALDVVKDFAPDLILLDVMMPGMDGPTTFKLLREDNNNGTIPVIFLTAKVQKQEVQAYLQLGAAGIISKPFDPLTLSTQILHILSQSSQQVMVA